MALSLDVMQSCEPAGQHTDATELPAQRPVTHAPPGRLLSLPPPPSGPPPAPPNAVASGAGVVDSAPALTSALSPPGLSGPLGYVDHSPQEVPHGANAPSGDKVNATTCRVSHDTDDWDSTQSTEVASDAGSGSDDQIGDEDGGPARALVILDWDDTLFPTSWVFKNRLMTEACSEEQWAELVRLTDVVQTTLTAVAECNGKVVIVTNADAGWVELSMSHFMPGLAPLVEDLEVISARALHEPSGLTCPFEWKRLTFADLCEDFYEANEARNILCFGDSMHEHHALACVVSDMTNTSSKSVKFAIRPELDHLRLQHERLHSSLSQILVHSGDLCIDL